MDRRVEPSVAAEVREEVGGKMTKILYSQPLLDESHLRWCAKNDHRGKPIPRNDAFLLLLMP